MGRLLGYMANRPDGLERAMEAEAELLTPPETSLRPGAWGVGFYQSGEVLHRKRPALSGEEVTLREIVDGLRTDCALIHLREATVGDFRKENTHPFRMRRWTFAHNGTVAGFEHLRAKLIDSLPDFLQRNIRGGTDSEVVFHLLLSFLHDAGQLDLPEPEAAQVVAAMRSTSALLGRYAEELRTPRPTLSFMLTEGRRMWALEGGLPLFYLDRSLREGGRRSPSTFRYLFLASLGSQEPPRGASVVEEGGVVMIDRELTVRSL